MLAFLQMAQIEFSGDAAGYAVLAVLVSAVEFLAACVVLYWIYFLLTLPMRRNERARFFLDLLELGLHAGQTAETALADAAASRDRQLGVRFHLLAAHLESGSRLGDALVKVPLLLPPNVVAMLRAGERLGDLARVLPACRKLLGDGVSQVRGALNYLLVLVFVITPFTIAVPVMLDVFVLPKFKEVFAGMGLGRPLPAFTVFVLSTRGLVTCVQIALAFLLMLLVVAYLGGPRLAGWLRRIWPGAPDWVQFQLPWRRKRLLRDFSAMLAVLLDAAVPESEAVTLAAEATDNGRMRQRGRQIVARLQGGAALPDALRAVDHDGELSWRIANALRGRRGFLRALTGWHEALDAKAFQLEQSAAQIATTLLVLFNGLIVASIVIGMFIVLIDLLNQATLW